MNPQIVETQMREILGPEWKAPRTEHDRNNYAALRDEGDCAWIAYQPPFWVIAATHPALRSECVTGADRDGLVLAKRFADMIAPNPLTLGPGDPLSLGADVLAQQAEEGDISADDLAGIPAVPVAAEETGGLDHDAGDRGGRDGGALGADPQDEPAGRGVRGAAGEQPAGPGDAGGRDAVSADASELGIPADVLAQIEEEGESDFAAEAPDDPNSAVASHSPLPSELPSVVLPSEADQVAGTREAYPGIAILPDDLGAARNAVIAEISRQKLIRLSVSADKAKRDYLAQCWQDATSLNALGNPVPEALARSAGEFIQLRNSDDAIYAWADTHERSAHDADMPTLQAMLKELHGGG